MTFFDQSYNIQFLGGFLQWSWVSVRQIFHFRIEGKQAHTGIVGRSQDKTIMTETDFFDESTALKDKEKKIYESERGHLNENSVLPVQSLILEQNVSVF